MLQQRPPFTIFMNHGKTNPKGPDWVGRGNIELNRRLYPARIAGWNRHGDKAGDFISLDIEIEGEGTVLEANNEHSQSSGPSSFQPAKSS